MVDKAGLYGGGLELTCILYEGAINVTSGSTVFVENGALGKNSVELAAAISEGDFVAIMNDAANDYDACGGLPVMMGALTTTTGFSGIVKSQPVWHKFPTGDTASWAADLAGGWFRVATVVFPGVTMAIRGVIEGTGMTAGSPVAWDLSEDAWADNVTTLTGAFSFHDGGTDAQNALIGFGAAGCIDASSGVIGHEVV